MNDMNFITIADDEQSTHPTLGCNKQETNNKVDTNNPAQIQNPMQNNVQNNCKHDDQILSSQSDQIDTSDGVIDDHSLRTPCRRTNVHENSINTKHDKNEYPSCGLPSTPSLTNPNCDVDDLMNGTSPISPKNDDVMNDDLKKSLIDFSSKTLVSSELSIMKIDDQTSTFNDINLNNNNDNTGSQHIPISYFVGESQNALSRSGHSDRRGSRRNRNIVRRFQKLDSTELTSTPAPDVKIGQRVAYKEYYGNEFGTIRWIGRVPQISPDWTVGVEFDNAIGEGDGSLNGRRYFIAKDCFAKFLPLDQVALVDQHVGRPEPGTMISVMSAAVRPGQMISIQRVSTVHVQHCFLNAPHRHPGAEFLAVNTRLHCQCPNCGPCAHVVKPPRTERLRTGKNATHMCQFSTYTCCGMESQEEALCTYTGNRISSTPPPMGHPARFDGAGLPTIGNSWIEGSGYLSNLQAEQSKLMPEEYRLGAAPEDVRLINGRTSSRRYNGKHQHSHSHLKDQYCNRCDNDSSLTRSMHDTGIRRKHHDRNAKRPKNSPVIQSPNPPKYGDQGMKCNIPECDCNNSIQQIENYDGKNKSHSTHNNISTASGSEKNAQSNSDTNLGKSNNPELLDIEGNHFSKISSEPASMKNMDSLQIVHQNQHPMGTDINEPKTSRVMYRDSIENRYLFPTDDVIDSTLEADLENLSEARYGNCNGTQQNGYSKNIFKSLRSLVSCLSTKANNSELEGHSEATIRIYEQPTDRVNKSKPICDGNNVSCVHGCERCEIDTLSDDYPSKGKLHNCDDDSMIKGPPPPFKSGVDFHSVGREPKLDTDKNDFYAPTSLACIAGHADFGETQQTRHSNIFHPNEMDKGTHIDCGYKQRRFGSSEASSSYGCWSSCGCLANKDFRTIEAMTQSTMIEQQIRRQISSSSDCGFSSASQNSINYVPSPPDFSPINLSLEEQTCINQVYNKIAARLISSNSSINKDDLRKLRSTLIEMHSDSCCLHSTCGRTIGHLSKSMISRPDCHQALVDIVKRTRFNNEPERNNKDCEPPEDRESPKVMNQTLEGETSDEKLDSVATRDQSAFSQRIVKDSKSKEEQEITTNSDIQTDRTVERNLELTTSDVTGKLVELPKTFELKLTLSINSDMDSVKTSKIELEQVNDERVPF